MKKWLEDASLTSGSCFSPIADLNGDVQMLLRVLDFSVDEFGPNQVFLHIEDRLLLGLAIPQLRHQIRFHGSNSRIKRDIEFITR